ncbi:hypothetical protein GCM10010987_61380 [Bradyrhizobium guangdongense]|uniref:PH domain-containing protein n=1 Tax=Bradyrhizobium guangdongense TaxID=1325090 RepID=A0A410UZQ3_9BRAD|nr:hypothetical protein X265_03640 [Bradyrhizobium guangdongense]QOZ57942.1 hypothetical protein XH86_03635 [Bradyrhizobium guangdongense]GGI30828.1 hypothetical protein GCM10010987_61380 [Bradyrhizobium guangdongense]
MNVEYDPEREAVAAMKLAAEADGAERQRWINAALAWIELTRLRGPVRPRAARRDGLVVGGALRASIADRIQYVPYFCDAIVRRDARG